MPTNLSALPSNKPVPNGKIQIKRGAFEGSLNVPGGVGLLHDGQAAYMQITYQPTYPCIWVVRANVMAQAENDGLGWRRWDWGVRITPADADGRTLGFRALAQIYMYSVVPWRTFSGSCAFRLSAGTNYTASLTGEGLGAGSGYYHTGPQWLRITGQVVSEGSI